MRAMAARHLVIATFLSTWATLVASAPTQVENPKGNYTVCKTEVCKQRAHLINASLDRCVDPCEDFYSYACGGWEKTHQVPESKSTTGNFLLLIDEVQQTLKDILENMTLVYEGQNITDKPAVAYNACMAVPELGDQLDFMKEIMNASGLSHWPIITNDTGPIFKNVTEVLYNTGIFTVLSIGVIRDIKLLNSNVIAVDQPSFGPVGRNQLIHPEAEGNKKLIQAYKELVKTALKLMSPNLSSQELTETCDKIVQFEGELANLTAPPEERRNLLDNYNEVTIGELQKNFTNVPLLDLLPKQFSRVNITLSGDEKVGLYALTYYSALDSFLPCIDPITLYNYAGLKVMLGMAAQASEEFRNASFELTKAQTGVVAERPRWETCVGIVSGQMPEVVGLLYVKHKFSEEAKKEVQDLAKRLMAVFNETLQEAHWMDNKTREAGEEKLLKMGTKIGYPDWLYNLTYLEHRYEYVPKLFRNHSFAQIMYWTAGNHWAKQMLKLRQPYDKSEWSTGPAVVGAFYIPRSNEMVYPSGILQGVLYQHGLPRSVNYGAIGMVVGHEMTHGFDDQGSQFDADGGLKQWWSKATRQKFEEKAKCFQYQYGNITDQAANMSLNGINTLGENIGDNGGLRTAFRAYEKLLIEECENNEARLPGLEDLSGRQLFFIANAMVWCSNSRPGYLRQQIQYDPHSPTKYRVNVPMANMQGFSTTFNCPANSTMNLNNRCTLW